MDNFNEYFQKYPMDGLSETQVLKSIAKEIHCAKKCLKKDKKGTEHLKYMARAYAKMETYFRLRNFDPDSIPM